MKIVIVGDGKVGLALTARLSRAGHDVVVIDRDPRVLEESLQTYDVMVVQGNGACKSVLEEAGIDTADLLIAATSSDEINLLCCMVANKMANVHTIARVRSPEYAGQLNFLKDELGLSMTINPEMAAAREIDHLLQFPSFLKRDRFAKGRVEIVELKICADSPLRGKPLSQLYKLIRVKVLVCAVERRGMVYIPSGAFTLEEGDKISVTADSKDLVTLLKNLGLTTERTRSALIIGGSRIAYYLARRLLSSGITVKIIEQDITRCEELAALLPKATIINADGSRQDILRAEGITSTDAVVTLTDMDEENLIISMYATHVGVPKSITKINRAEYVDTFSDLGIDTVISPKDLCCTDIVRYVRAMENTTGGAVQTLHYIVEGKAEALEFVVTSATRHLDEPLTQVPIKPNILLSCILRGGKTIIPQGSDCIRLGDTVIVVTTAEQTIRDLGDIFAG